MRTGSKTPTGRVDLYQAVTDAVVAELEHGLKLSMLRLVSSKAPAENPPNRLVATSRR